MNCIWSLLLPSFCWPMNVSSVVFSQAQDFRQHGTQIRRKMWWQNMKIKLIVLAILIVLILIIVLSICGGFKCWRWSTFTFFGGCTDQVLLYSFWLQMTVSYDSACIVFFFLFLNYLQFLDVWGHSLLFIYYSICSWLNTLNLITSRSG